MSAPAEPTPAGARDVRSLAELAADPRNPRALGAAAGAGLGASMQTFGDIAGIVWNRRTGHLVTGHQRVGQLAAAGATSWTETAPGAGYIEHPATGERFGVRVVDWEPAEQTAANLAANNPAVAGHFTAGLPALLDEVSRALPELYARVRLDALATAEGIITGAARAVATARLAERFLVPPFSVLDARQGYWRERKRAWLAVGIQSELGRAGLNLLGISATVIAEGKVPRRLTFVPGSRPPADDTSRRIPASGPRPRVPLPGLVPATQWQAGEYDERRGAVYDDGDVVAGTSVFDPVLREIVYRWFSPPGGAVLDPFAGGSVRGVVAAACGRRYAGVELSGAQVAANEAQWGALGGALPALHGVGNGPLGPPPPPRWIEGDADGALPAGPADLIFTCPPYFDLERYSDDPRDLSNMAWPEFCAAYRRIVAEAVARLSPDRFSAWVVSDVRAPGGAYRGLRALTVEAHAAAGADLYNEAVLVTAVGSLPIRAGRPFSGSRKLGRAHQDVLIFVKGSGARAAAACGAVEVADGGPTWAAPGAPAPTG